LARRRRLQATLTQVAENREEALRATRAAIKNAPQQQATMERAEAALTRRIESDEAELVSLQAFEAQARPAEIADAGAQLSKAQRRLQALEALQAAAGRRASRWQKLSRAARRLHLHRAADHAGQMSERHARMQAHLQAEVGKQEGIVSGLDEIATSLAGDGSSPQLYDS
jgi:hypothetical protein